MRLILKLIMKIVKLVVSLILVIIFSVVALGVYATFIERNLLINKKHEIIINEDGKESLKVVQFTDTQLGEYYTIENLEKAVKKINDLEADIVVFTGDLIDNAAKYEDLYKVSEVLSKIEANIGKYAIYGNHDIGGGAVRYYKDIMSESGFTILENSKETIDIGNKKVNIFGGDDGLLGYHNAIETMEGIDEEDINILLIHEPDLIDEYIDYPIDLALSGHSHGGQVYIPFYGPIKKNELAKKYNKGLYNIDNNRNTKLYVSSGLGNTKVPFRLGNIPAIEIFNISF